MIEYQLNKKIIVDHPELRKLAKKIKLRMLSKHIVNELAIFFKITEKRVNETIYDAYLAAHPNVNKNVMITALVLLLLSRKKRYKNMSVKDMGKVSKREFLRNLKEVGKVVNKDYEYLTKGVIDKIKKSS
jgi:hypothetical protein